MAAIERLRNDQTGQLVEGMLINSDDVAVLFLEVILSESRTITSKVTEHPVENGSQISDHIIKGNKKFNLKVSISDATVLPGSGVSVKLPQKKGFLGLLNKIGFIEQFFDNKRDKDGNIIRQDIKVLDIPAGRQVAQEARGTLEALRDNREVLTLRTSIGDFPNVVITSITSTRDSSKSYRTFEFDLELIQIQLVNKSATIKFVKRKPEAAGEASDKKDLGKSGVKKIQSELVKGLKTVAGIAR